MYSPLFLIKNVLAITLGSYPHWQPPHLFFPSIVGLMASSLASDEETLTLKGGNNTLCDTAVSLSVLVSRFSCDTCICFIWLCDCPLRNNQELWHGLKSCLASGCQFPPGWPPPLPAVVERAIQTTEKSVFQISGWFALPCTPPHPTPPAAAALRPGLRTAAYETPAEYRCTPHRLTNNNRATEGVMEKLPCWRAHTSLSHSCHINNAINKQNQDKAGDHSKCCGLINT